MSSTWVPPVAAVASIVSEASEAPGSGGLPAAAMSMLAKCVLAPSQLIDALTPPVQTSATATPSSSALMVITPAMAGDTKANNAAPASSTCLMCASPDNVASVARYHCVCPLPRGARRAPISAAALATVGRCSNVSVASLTRAAGGGGGAV